jgi:hypothetical protein
VQHTLAKEPSNRPESMEKFLTEFRSVRVYKEPPRPSRRRDNDE